MNEMIKTDDVYYEYRVNDDTSESFEAVSGVSMAINQGEFIAILGRNGSGKSTLARLMNALLIPKKGRIVIDGLDTANGELVWNIRKSLGLVFQNPDNQIVATTVEEDVAFGPENLGVIPQEIRTRVDESLKTVGMEAFLSHSPHMLSGGQKQRIAIAGVLAMEPKCIVLDEATSMLDPSGRKEVMQVLHALNREKGITILLITHHMEEAVEADQIMIMQEGRLILKGTPRQIFQNVEEIRSAGLDVPHMTSLAYELKQNGFNIKELPVNLKEMSDTLRELLKDKSAKLSGEQVKDGFYNNGTEIKADEGKDIIRIVDMSHVYMADTTFEQRALKNINLSIKKGEIFGIIGHTGSGKTTLVQHLNGILKPTSGSILVDGLEVSGKALKGLRKRIGLIFQYPEHQLFEETVYRDIAFGPQKMGLSEDEIKRRIFHVIELLDISPELLEKSPFELSGGQKRKVAIAGVLAMEPEVLVLDEPTAGLDPKGSYDVFEILRKLNEDNGTTIIIISHNMNDIASICNRIAVMANGEMKMCDTAKNIFSRSNDLKNYGLELPKVTELFQILRADGYDLPSAVLSVKEAVKILSRLLKLPATSGGVLYDR